MIVLLYIRAILTFFENLFLTTEKTMNAAFGFVLLIRIIQYMDEKDVDKIEENWHKMSHCCK